MAAALFESKSDNQITVLGFTQIISDAFDLSIYNYVALFLLCVPVVLCNVLFGWSEYKALFAALGEFSSNPSHLRVVLNESSQLSWISTATGIWTFLISCGITQLFHDRLNKLPGSAAQSVIAGMKRAPMAFAVALVVCIAIMAAVTLLFVALGPLTQLLGKAASILVLVTVVAVVFLYLQYAIAFAACVLDRIGPIAAYRSARELTHGFRWSLFGLFLFAGLFFMLLKLLMVAIAGALIWVSPSVLMAVVISAVLSLLSPLAMGWTNGLMVASYNRLKALKGQISLGEAAA